MADEKTTATTSAQESKGPVAKVQEPPTMPSTRPVVARPNRDAIEAARLAAAKTENPETVYEVNVSQWGHDDNRFVRGQLVTKADCPPGYDWGHARRTETVIPSTISKADYERMKKEATEAAIKAEEEEGAKV